MPKATCSVPGCDKPAIERLYERRRKCNDCTYLMKCKSCVDCGAVCSPNAERCTKCYRIHNREGRHNAWKGGRHLSNGYVMVLVRDHPRAQVKKQPYIAEHILVMEKALGRYLYDDEHVHHLNGNRSDNRIENLELWSTCHPYGQRASDLVAWARVILERYA